MLARTVWHILSAYLSITSIYRYIYIYISLLNRFIKFLIDYSVYIRPYCIVFWKREWIWIYEFERLARCLWLFCPACFCCNSLRFIILLRIFIFFPFDFIFEGRQTYWRAIWRLIASGSFKISKIKTQIDMFCSVLVCILIWNLSHSRGERGAEAKNTLNLNFNSEWMTFSSKRTKINKTKQNRVQSQSWIWRCVAFFLLA